MNDNYKSAVDGLKELPAKFGVPNAHPVVLATIQARATLAVAEEQAKTNQHLELANLIAYAQLRRDRRRSSMAAEELVDRRMAAAFREINDELTEEDEDR